MSFTMRMVFLGAALIVPLALGGCPGTEEDGTGGDGGTGGTQPKDTVTELCERLDECNELVGIDVSECTDLTNFCVDDTFPTTSLRNDWELLVEDCQEFSTCAVFAACYAELTCSLDGEGPCSGPDGGVEITCFPDGDMDGWPSDSGAVTACSTCPAGFVQARTDVDCDDGNPDVFPGNEMFYFDCRPCGMQCCTGDERFDYNCDGVSELEYPNESTCPCPGSSGFVGMIPDCGVQGDFFRCISLAMGLCEVANFVTRQACR